MPNENRITIIIDANGKLAVEEIKRTTGQASSSMKNMATQTATAASSITGYWLGIAAAIYGAKRAYDAFVASPLDYLGKIETANLGIASSFLTQGKYVNDITDKVLEGEAAFSAAMADSSRIVDQLRLKNLETIATLDQLVIGYQQTLPVALGKGFNKNMVMDFTTAMVQAAGAIDPMLLNQLAEETRSMLMGTINPRNSRIAVALGITNEDIRQNSANAQQLYDFLMSKLAAYQRAGVESQKTWAGVWSNTKDTALMVGGQVLEPLFTNIKNWLLDAQKNVMLVDEATGKVKGFKPEFLDSFKVIKDFIGFVSSTGLGTLSLLWDSMSFGMDVMNKFKLATDATVFVVGTSLALMAIPAAVTAFKTLEIVAYRAAMAMLTTPVGWIAAGVGLLAVAVNRLRSQEQEYNEAIKSKDLTKIDELIKKYEKLLKAQDQASIYAIAEKGGNTEEYKKKLAELKAAATAGVGHKVNMDATSYRNNPLKQPEEQKKAVEDWGKKIRDLQTDMAKAPMFNDETSKKIIDIENKYQDMLTEATQKAKEHGVTLDTSVLGKWRDVMIAAAKAEEQQKIQLDYYERESKKAADLEELNQKGKIDQLKTQLDIDKQINDLKLAGREATGEDVSIERLRSKYDFQRKSLAVQIDESLVAAKMAAGDDVKLKAESQKQLLLYMQLDALTKQQQIEEKTLQTIQQQLAFESAIRRELAWLDVQEQEKVGSQRENLQRRIADTQALLDSYRQRAATTGDDKVAEDLRDKIAELERQLYSFTFRMREQTGSAFDGMRVGLGQWIYDLKTQFQTGVEFAKTAADGMRQGMEDFFFDPTTFNFDNFTNTIRRAWAKLMSDMVADEIRAAMKSESSSGILNSVLGGLGRLLGLTGALPEGSAITYGDIMAADESAVWGYHSGGLIPAYHSGGRIRPEARGPMSEVGKRLAVFHPGGPVYDDSIIASQDRAIRRAGYITRTEAEDLRPDERIIKAKVGEYVIRDEIVRRVGVPYLDALNRGDRPEARGPMSEVSRIYPTSDIRVPTSAVYHSGGPIADELIDQPGTRSTYADMLNTIIPDEPRRTNYADIVDMVGRPARTGGSAPAASQVSIKVDGSGKTIGAQPSPGNINVFYHIVAMDAQSLQEFVDRNPGAFLKPVYENLKERGFLVDAVRQAI